MVAVKGDMHARDVAVVALFRFFRCFQLRIGTVRCSIGVVHEPEYVPGVPVYVFEKVQVSVAERNEEGKERTKWRRYRRDNRILETDGWMEQSQFGYV
jgi:hypothetical protein